MMHCALAADLCDTEPFHFFSSFVVSATQTLAEVFHDLLCLLSVLRSVGLPVGECYPVVSPWDKIPLNQPAVPLDSVPFVILLHLFGRRFAFFLPLLSGRPVPPCVPLFDLPAVVKYPCQSLVHVLPLTLIWLIKSYSGQMTAIFLTFSD